MRRHRTLEDRLVEWGKEYGGGRYQDIGYASSSTIAYLMKWQGKPPSRGGSIALDTAADEVHDAVVALSIQVDGRVPSQVIRAEYQAYSQPMEMKLQRLRARGENLSRVRYYQHLRLARIHVAAWLKIAFSELSQRAEHEEAPGTASV